MRPVRRLTRSITFESRSAIHRDPKPSASPIGATSPLTRPLGLFVRGSTRMTVRTQWPPAAQTARLSAARNAQGCPDRRTLAVTAFVAGSMRMTALRLGTLTQTAPPPAVIAM